MRVGFNRMVLLSVILLFACSEDQPKSQIDPSSYLSLEVGNYWEFKYEVLTVNTIVKRREVTDVTTINGKEYFVVVDTDFAGDLAARDTAYYRIQNHDVYTYVPETVELDLYRLDSENGDSWSFPYYHYEAEVHVTESRVTLGSTTIDHCKNFEFGIKEWSDDEKIYTLAPDIGFVKLQGSDPVSALILKNARVKGIGYNF